MKNNLFANLRVSFLGEFVAKIPLFFFELLLVSHLSYVNYALWSTYQIALKATPYYHFGILSYYNKYFPILTGEGKKEDAKIAQRLTYQSMLMIASCILFICIFLGVYLYFWGESKTTSIYIVLIGLIIFFAQGYIFYQAQYRSQLNFNKAVTGLLIYTFTMFIAGYFLIELLEIYGALISLILANFMAWLYYKENKEVNRNYFSTAKNSFKLGIAPFSVTISHYILHTSDRIFFSINSEDIVLAGYGFCFIFIQLSYMFASSIGTVITPYTLRKVGKGDYKAVFSYCSNFSYVVAGLVVVAIVIVQFSKKWFLAKYFPQYIFIAEALPIYILISFFLTVSLTYFSAIFGAHKEKYLTVLNIFFMLVNIGALSLTAHYMGSDSLFLFSYVSAATFLVYFLCCLGLFIFVNYKVDLKAKCIYILKIFSILLVAILTVLVDRII